MPCVLTLIANAFKRLQTNEVKIKCGLKLFGNKQEYGASQKNDSNLYHLNNKFNVVLEHTTPIYSFQLMEMRLETLIYLPTFPIIGTKSNCYRYLFSCRKMQIVFSDRNRNLFGFSLMQSISACAFAVSICDMQRQGNAVNKSGTGHRLGPVSVLPGDWERQTRSINHRDFQCQRVRAFNRDTHLRRLSTTGKNLDGGDTVGYLTSSVMLKEIAKGNYSMTFSFINKSLEVTQKFNIHKMLEGCHFRVRNNI